MPDTNRRKAVTWRTSKYPLSERIWIAWKVVKGATFKIRADVETDE